MSVGVVVDLIYGSELATGSLFFPAGRRWPEGLDEGGHPGCGGPLIASLRSALLPKGRRRSPAIDAGEKGYPC
jgi:hypothetical protein